MYRTTGIQVAVKKKRGPARPKDAVGGGAFKLSKAADSAVLKNSKAIAASLLKSTLEGNVASLKELLTLAERAGAGEQGGVFQLTESLASAWAAQPQWTGEVVESTAETAPGSREPES